MTVKSFLAAQQTNTVRGAPQSPRDQRISLLPRREITLKVNDNPGGRCSTESRVSVPLASGNQKWSGRERHREALSPPLKPQTKRRVTRRMNLRGGKPTRFNEAI